MGASPPSDTSPTDADVPPTTTITTISTLLREFTITVVLSFLCLLALLFTIQYHIRLFLGGGELPSCPSCTRAPTPCPHTDTDTRVFVSLSPLDVLKITTVCALFVFVSMELVARALRRPGLSLLDTPGDPNSNFDDVEAALRALPPLEKPPVVNDSKPEVPLPSPRREASLLPL
ncbi:hypothetical protein B0H16DRAFT_1528179 [Mycena metata]|uniref:Uncharacterized protein n=1 Tax=Mycena metata TaxID=1033252 RepID=A0AAD7JEU3_9AGAR|nr:hypothetical protein B0H16DRAFT_1528179 [Mycena metata]